MGAGIDHLAALAAYSGCIDLDNVTVVGHSAGGHLALWAALGSEECVHGYHPKHVRITAAAGLAPVADLVMGYAGGNAEPL